MSEKTRTHTAGEELNAQGSRAELIELLSEFRTGILVTRDDRGLPRARPLAILKCDRDGAVWFATSDHTPKIEEILRDPGVAVICHRTRDEAWISLSGGASLTRDRERARELWNAGMRAWFSGPDDPSLVLIRVAPRHAEYYEPKKPFLVRALELAKGMVGNEPPKIGTTKHLDFDRLSEPGRLSY